MIAAGAGPRVLGTAMTPFGRHENCDAVELAAIAAKQAMDDAGLTANDIDALYLGNFVGQSLTGQGVLAALVARRLGMKGVPATTVEGACASGSIAFRQGVLTCLADPRSIALCIGAEHLTHASTVAVTGALAEASDRQSDGVVGLTFAGYYGLVASAHAARYGTTRAHLSAVSVVSRHHAAQNDLAMFRTPLSAAEIENSKFVADPLRLFDCCPISDGAAAAVVGGAQLQTLGRGRTRILACEQASGPVAIADIEDLTTSPTTKIAARQAYQKAGILADRVDVAELHDCFSIAAIVDSEDLGFFAPGEAGPAFEANATSVESPGLVINPSGGLLARGHPVGATGLAQIHEINQQLRGQAVSQVLDCEVGLAHNLGGAGAAAMVTLLGAPE